MKQLGIISGFWSRTDEAHLNKVIEAKKITHTIEIDKVKITVTGQMEQHETGEYFNIEEIKCDQVLDLLLNGITFDQISDHVNARF